MYFFAVIFCGLFCVVVTDECKSWSPTYSNHLSTKTPYRLVANKNVTRLSFENCKLEKLWMVIRHGTRYPKQSLINKFNDGLVLLAEDIVKNIRKKKSVLCKEYIKYFNKWISSLVLNENVKEKDLTDEGEVELFYLAERFQKRMPAAFPRNFSPSVYKMRSTDTQRTIESKRHFFLGLGGASFESSLKSLGEEESSKLTRFHKLCPRWQRDVHKNPLSLLEQKKFEDTPIFYDMIRGISDRLGFNTYLSRDTIYTMYEACAFETAWFQGERSPWCAVFTDEELALLEYSDDLKHFHIRGYGHPLNYLQSCHLVQDAINHLTSNGGPITSLTFTHSGPLLMFTSHLGLFNQTIRHNHRDPDRLWRLSKMGGFASNVALAKYRCGSEEKLLTLYQERPVKLPGCPADEPLCPLQVLLDAHGGSRTNCRFDEMCRIPEHNEF